MAVSGMLAVTMKRVDRKPQALMICKGQV